MSGSDWSSTPLDLTATLTEGGVNYEFADVERGAGEDDETRPQDPVAGTSKRTPGSAFECSVCGKRYAGRKALMNHLKFHLGIKPHQCTVCGAAFTVRAVMLQHMRVHTGEKPFQCDQCGATFGYGWTLAEHKRTHTGTRPYRCPQCDKSFVRRSNLVQHLRNKHTAPK